MQEIAHSLFLKRKPFCAEPTTERETGFRQKAACAKYEDWACACVWYLYSFHVLRSTPDNSAFSSYFDICSSWVSVRLRGRAFIARSLSLSLSLVCRMNNMPSGGPLCRTDGSEREIAGSSFSLCAFFFSCMCACIWLKTSGVSTHRRLINWSIQHVQSACHLIRRARRSC